MPCEYTTSGFDDWDLFYPVFDPGCQFKRSGKEIFDFDGKKWCQYHLPVTGKNKESSPKATWDDVRIEAFYSGMIEYIIIQSEKFPINLSGVVFPPRLFSNKFLLGYINERRNKLPSLLFYGSVFCDDLDLSKCKFEDTLFFSHCTFEKEVRLSHISVTGGFFFSDSKVYGDADFSRSSFSAASITNSRFGKRTSFARADLGDAYFDETVFDGHVTFFGAGFGEATFARTCFHLGCDFSGHNSGSEKVPEKSEIFQDIDFTNAAFLRTAKFSNRTFLDRTIFADATFLAAPQFFGSRLHADTDFSGARFHDTGGGHAARAYRALRHATEQIRARSDEATFFALEQKSLRNQTGVPVSIKLVSWLYEKCAGYGQSLIRPFVGLAATTGCSFLFFLGTLKGPKISWSDMAQVLHFAFTQVVRPFDALVVRATSGTKYSVMQIDLGIIVVAATQSLLSIAFIALFLIALRRRFRMG